MPTFTAGCHSCAVSAFRFGLVGLLLLTCGSLLTGVSAGAEIVRVTAENRSEIVPKGKEADAIIGDYVLRNDKIIAVVADTLADRKANMTTAKVGGCVIDLTSRDRQNDQLTCYYPGGMSYLFTKATAEKASGDEVVLVCQTEDEMNPIAATVVYRLKDGDDFVQVEQRLHNRGKEAKSLAPIDMVRADKTFKKSPAKATWFWADDLWFGQSYGLIASGPMSILDSSDTRTRIQYQPEGKAKPTLEPGQTLTLSTRIFPAPHRAALDAIAQRITDGPKSADVNLRVVDAKEQPVHRAMVTMDKLELGRTDANGVIVLPLPQGKHLLNVHQPAYGAASAEIAVEAAPIAAQITLPSAPVFTAKITDANGQPTPCKIQFIGEEGTENPNFGPNTQGPAVENLYYSHTGSFSLPVPAGKYRVRAIRGPEYDLVEQKVIMKPGETTTFAAKLIRSVDTKGWVSSDLHSHSTPSGDNVTETTARVLNLLAEHIEFAPCTEHNRIETYIPILEAFGCRPFIGTCSGMELTGETLPLNHQNAFPLLMKAGLQDNGAPKTDADPEAQIERLARWDNGSDKLVQQNHPDMGWMFFDKNGDGQYDGGLERMFGWQDVVEIWGNDYSSMVHESILGGPYDLSGKTNNRPFNWLQLLNQGRRMVGVSNTDAHYSNHGSGWTRNYVRSSTDDPARIDPMEMVHEFERGHVVVTNGPFLEATAQAGEKTALPGDVLAAPAGPVRLKIRVQCPNWLDVNRIQVLVNGRPAPEYNFTRTSNPERFGDGVVKFDQTIDFNLPADAHLIVVAIGEGLNLGGVWGPKLLACPPTAFSNPIYVDLDGQGFTPSGDTLGVPLPVKNGVRQRAANASK